jgi:hypothetical protein
LQTVKSIPGRINFSLFPDTCLSADRAIGIDEQPGSSAVFVFKEGVGIFKIAALFFFLKSILIILYFHRNLHNYKLQ